MRILHSCCSSALIKYIPPWRRFVHVILRPTECLPTFDCPRSSYCGGRNCLSVARNLVGVCPRGENCFDEAAPSEFISGVNRFRISRCPAGALVLLQVTGNQFSLMYQRRGFGTLFAIAVDSAVLELEHAPSCLVFACPTLRTNYGH